MQTTGKRSAVPGAHRTGSRDLFGDTWSIKLVASAPAAGPLLRPVSQARKLLLGRVPPTGPSKTARDLKFVALPKPEKTDV